MEFSVFFEFYELEKFPKTDWMFLFQDPDKYGTRIELAEPRKIQQCQSCGAAICPEKDKVWALKTGAKNYYRYYSYLCERCYGNAPKIIAVWEEMGRPSYNNFSQDLTSMFKRFRKRLVEEQLVEFATEKRLKDWRNNHGALPIR